MPIAEPEQVQDEKGQLRIQIGGRDRMGEEQPTGTEIAWELEDWSRLCIPRAEGWPARPAAVKGPGSQ